MFSWQKSSAVCTFIVVTLATSPVEVVVAQDHTHLLRGLKPADGRQQKPKPEQPPKQFQGVVHAKGNHGKPKVVTGHLGNLGVSDLSPDNEENVNVAAVNAMTTLAQNHFSSPTAQFKVKGKPSFLKGKKESTHIRFVNTINGKEVEGASVMMHADKDGNIIGINGEVVSDDTDSIGDLSAGGKLPPKQAIDIALQELNLQDVDGECEGNIEMTIVATNELVPWYGKRKITNHEPYGIYYALTFLYDIWF
jgi:Zn-dependent metalloprotease